MAFEDDKKSPFFANPGTSSQTEGNCPGSLSIQEAWARIAVSHIPRWCNVCKRFRNGICMIVEEYRAKNAARAVATRIARGKGPGRHK